MRGASSARAVANPSNRPSPRQQPLPRAAGPITWRRVNAWYGAGFPSTSWRGPMGLNIKNEETCRLASELARLTGTTKTGAITLALRDRLERESKRRGKNARLRDMRSIAERCAALVGPGTSSGDHGDMLYDERGLPSDRGHGRVARSALPRGRCNPVRDADRRLALSHVRSERTGSGHGCGRRGGGPLAMRSMRSSPAPTLRRCRSPQTSSTLPARHGAATARAITRQSRARRTNRCCSRVAISRRQTSRRRKCRAARHLQ